MRKKEGREQKT